jgi:hypothetical protein
MVRETSTSDSESDSDGNVSRTRQRTYSDSTRLKVWNGWPIHIAVSQEPASADIPDDFGVNLFVTNANGKNVDIARIDTDHSGCHFDRFYLPEGKPERTEDYTVQYEDPDEALLHFVKADRWEHYVKRYHENHGLPQEARVYGED